MRPRRWSFVSENLQKNLLASRTISQALRSLEPTCGFEFWSDLLVLLRYLVERPVLKTLDREIPYRKCPLSHLDLQYSMYPRRKKPRAGRLEMMLGGRRNQIPKLVLSRLTFRIVIRLCKNGGPPDTDGQTMGSSVIIAARLSLNSVERTSSIRISAIRADKLCVIAFQRNACSALKHVPRPTKLRRQSLA